MGERNSPTLQNCYWLKTNTNTHHSSHLKGNKRQLILEPNLNDLGLWGGSHAMLTQELYLHMEAVIEFYRNRTKEVTNPGNFKMHWWGNVRGSYGYKLQDGGNLSSLKKKLNIFIYFASKLQCPLPLLPFPPHSHFSYDLTSPHPTPCLFPV